jgi:hypothetical protein
MVAVLSESTAPCLSTKSGELQMRGDDLVEPVIGTE